MKTSTFSGFIAIFTVYKQFFWHLNFSNHRTKESFVAAKWACKYRRIFVGYLKLFRFMSVRMMPNKMQIKQRAELSLKLCSIYSEQRNWKQKVLRRNKTTWKMAKWDFTWILTLERWRKTRGWLWCSKNKICVRRRRDWILAPRAQQRQFSPGLMESIYLFR